MTLQSRIEEKIDEVRKFQPSMLVTGPDAQDASLYQEIIDKWWAILFEQLRGWLRESFTDIAHLAKEEGLQEGEKKGREAEREELLELIKPSTQLGDALNATEGAFEPSKEEIIEEEVWNACIKNIRQTITSRTPHN